MVPAPADGLELSFRDYKVAPHIRGHRMPWEIVLAHVLLPLLIAAAAGFGAWRCWRLLRLAQDPRLLKLMWFYGLFAASLVAYAVWLGQLHAGVSIDSLSGMHSGNSTSPHGADSGSERVDLFLVAHHALMLASLGVAVEAFSHRRGPALVAAAAGVALLEPFIPAFLAIEAALTLYLAAQAVLNHLQRRTPGALQVAAGFLLFFLGHLGFFLLHHPGGARSPLGDIFALVGILLLVRLLPRPTA
jgi:hypothetical protein